MDQRKELLFSLLLQGQINNLKGQDGGGRQTKNSSSVGGERQIVDISDPNKTEGWREAKMLNT